MISKHIKRCSTSSVLKKTQIKTTVKYHIIPSKMAIIKKIVGMGEDVEKLDPYTL